MNLYNELVNIFPYLVSIRKLENYVSIDIEFPKLWKYPKKYVDEKTMVEQKSGKEDVRLISFATQFDEGSLNQLFGNISGIIKYNKEREEKENLFENKVKELKYLFEQNKLDNLKKLEFSIKDNIELESIDDEGAKNIRLVPEGD